jgi:hypothetical protein
MSDSNNNILKVIGIIVIVLLGLYFIGVSLVTDEKEKNRKWSSRNDEWLWYSKDLKTWTKYLNPDYNPDTSILPKAIVKPFY